MRDREPHTTAVLDLIKLTDERKRTFFDALTEDKRAEAGTPERWSAKDLIAHLTAWKRHHLGNLEMLRRGQAPVAFPEIDVPNAQIFAAHQGETWATVTAERERASLEYEMAIAEHSEDELADPGRFPVMAGMSLGEWFLGNSAWHPYGASARAPGRGAAPPAGPGGVGARTRTSRRSARIGPTRRSSARATRRGC